MLRTLTPALSPRCPECAKVYAEMRRTGNLERATKAQERALRLREYRISQRVHKPKRKPKKKQPNVKETASEAVSRIAKNLPPRLW